MAIRAKLLSACLAAGLILSPCVFALQAQEQKESPKAPGALGPAETLSGTIMMVEVQKKLLIVKASSGVPYNFVVTPATRITAGKERLKLADLSARTDKAVTVRFVPTRQGNLARSVELAP